MIPHELQFEDDLNPELDTIKDFLDTNNKYARNKAPTEESKVDLSTLDIEKKLKERHDQYLKKK